MSLRIQMINAARDLYLQDGLNGLSMRKVAALCEVTAPAIYKHFTDKDQLVAAMVEEGFSLLEAELKSALRARSPLARLRKMGQAYRRFALDQGAYYQLIFMSTAQDHGLTQVTQRVQDQLSPSFLLLLHSVQAYLDETKDARQNHRANNLSAQRFASKSSAVVNTEALTLSAKIWAFLHGLVSLYLVGHYAPVLHSRHEFEHFFDQAWDEFLSHL